MIDALGRADDFEKAGIGHEQVRRMAEAIRNRLGESLATKSDLQIAVSDLRAELHREMNNMAWKMAGLLIVQAGAIVALLKVFGG